MENVSRTTLLAQAAPSPHLKSPRHRLDNTKRKGELSEAAFLLKAASLGFGVAKPWGDSERYDFILDPHDYKIHGQGAPPLSRSLRQSGDFDSPTLSSRAQSRDLVVSDAASNPGFGRGAPCLASFARRGNVTVAPALSRSLRQGGSFDFDGATSVPAGPKDSADFASPTLSSRAKSRDLVFPAPRLWRVQLKWHRRPPYDVQPIYSIYGQGKRVYTANDIDVLVAHIVPLDVWYVLPVAAFSPGKSLRFYPDAPCKRARFEHFREAWHLLR